MSVVDEYPSGHLNWGPSSDLYRVRTHPLEDPDQSSVPPADESRNPDQTPDNANAIANAKDKNKENDQGKDQGHDDGFLVDFRSPQAPGSGSGYDLDFEGGGGRGGKKRKVPGGAQLQLYGGSAVPGPGSGTEMDSQQGRQWEELDYEDDDESSERQPHASTKDGASHTNADGKTASKSADPASSGDTSNSAPGIFVRKNLNATKACYLREYRKGLFLRRKAAFITLYLDAHNVIKNSLSPNGTTSAGKSKPSAGTSSNIGTTTGSGLNGKFPDVSEFEKLLPVLDEIGLDAWSPDRPGWRDGDDKMEPVRWRRTKRTRAAHHRKPVERKGWMPEGSFEFEVECEASKTLRAKTRQQTALLRLANELRALILTANRSSTTITTTTTTTKTTSSSKPTVDDSQTDRDGLPSKTRRKLDQHKKSEPTSTRATGGDQAHTTLAAPSQAPVSTTSTLEQAQADDQAHAQSQPMSQAPSKDSTETSKGKKKPKKKKRSVLANQSNPHHVDNYRPSRTVSPHSDPYEPYSHHLSLFAPPSMPFLAVRPRTNFNPDGPFVVRPAEDDYICSFCEFDLYYGSEKSRRLAIRRRKREIKRKETIKNKARNVAEGRGKLNENDDEDDEDYGSGDEDEDEDDFADEKCQDDGHGRCTCGRSVKKPKPDKPKIEPEPPIQAG
ncbi:hypothetical protein IAU59_002121 [Kwoniella sp. CBS 9459]